MGNIVTYNSRVSTLILCGGGNNCLLINILHKFRGGFGFKTAASSCPDIIGYSGIAAFSPSEFSSNFNKPIIFSKK